ncbi:hypothetical protein PFISCL1PPCAC_27610, partial [Pristionchus fissidentatus]
REMQLVLLLFLPALAFSCTSDPEIIAQLRRQNIGGNNVKDVQLELNIENANRVGKEKVVFIEGFVQKKWHDDSLNFEKYDPCSDLVIVSDVAHPVSFSDNQHISDAVVSKNGTVTVKELVSAKENCFAKELSFPLRSMKCALKFPMKRNTVDVKWTNAQSKSPAQYEVIHSSVTDSEVEVVLKYKLQYRKALIEFFLPAIIFMAISWFSLALGPMSITRSILIVGSFLLLMRHFSYPPEGMPSTKENEMSAFVIWKTFSYLFVLLTLVELVVVSCLMSIGQGPSACCRKDSGDYDFEPIYEELNDLRKRNSHGNTEYRMRYTEKRTGCTCCRFCALFLDLSTMVFLAASLVIFTILFFNDDFMLVETINNFSLEKYIKL